MMMGLVNILESICIKRHGLSLGVTAYRNLISHYNNKSSSSVINRVKNEFIG